MRNAASLSDELKVLGDGMPRSNWSAIAAHLTGLDRTALLVVLRDLYQSSAEAQELLTLRVLSQQPAALLRHCRRRIAAQFRPGAEGRLPDIIAARQLIQHYEQLTRDQTGALDLALTIMEHGTRFTNTYGSLDADFYADLETVLAELVQHLSSRRGRALYPKFRPRLLNLQRDSQLIGWGYEDAVREAIDQLRGEHDDWPDLPAR